MNQPPVFRIRITYSKLNALRYTGSLDMQSIWERSFRRAGLPLAYSQGFHPQPRINQALPLPLGMTSQNDLAEFWLEQVMDVSHIANTLRLSVPPGLNISLVQVIDLRAPTLPNLVVSADYRITLLSAPSFDEIINAINLLLARPQIIREKRGKTYDLRPLIEQLTLQPRLDDHIQLVMRLSAREGATGRPEEVLSALGLDPLLARIERFNLVLLPQGD